MLLLLWLQVWVTGAGADGTMATGKAGGTLTIKVEWGVLKVPMDEIDLMDLCPVREEVMANLGGRVNREIEGLEGKEADAAEAALVALGWPALEYLQPLAESSQGNRAERLWRIVQAIQQRGARPSIDRVQGPGLAIRGWVQSESFTLDGKAVTIARTALVRRVNRRERAGGIILRMTDGSVIAGKFAKGTIKVGGSDVALEKVRTIVIAPGGKARIEADKVYEGKIDAATISFETAFGALDLPVKSIGAAMRADWSMYNSPAPDAQGCIRDWLVYGNLPQENDEFEKNHLDAVDEAAVVPTIDEEMFGRKWIAFGSPRADVALLEALPKERKENFVAYGAVYIRAQRTTPTILNVSSDDGVRVWLNGALIHSNHVHRGVTEWGDHVSVTLQAGWNRVLLKVDNGGGPSGWRFQLLDESNRPMKEFMLSLKPPPIFLGR